MSRDALSHARSAARTILGLVCLSLLLSPGAATAQDPCADHVPQAKPQNASRDIVGQELDAIIDRGFLTVAVYEDFPPYSWEDGGKAKGIDVDIGHLIAESLGVEARFNFVPAGENLEADLRNNVWKGPLIGGTVSNVMMRVPYDSRFACRVEQVVFTGQYTTEQIAIGYDRSEYPDDPPTPPYFRFDTVAVENDSIADFYLSAFPGGQLARNVRRFPKMLGAMDALVAGDTKAAMGPLSQIEFSLTEDLGVHTPPLPGFAAGSWTIGLGVNFRYRPLAYSVDDAIWAGLADGSIEAIHQKYGVTFHPPER